MFLYLQLGVPHLETVSSETLQSETNGNLQGSCKRVFSNDFGKTKIGQLHVEVLVCKKNVFRLDITMDNAPVMLQEEFQPCF